jgi:hypothetical protein
MTTTRELPDVPAILGALVARVAQAEQPLFLAIAERMAAERYRGWADHVDDPDVRAGLIACAAREDEIADRVEAVFPDPAAVQQRLLAAFPELPQLNRDVFAGRPLADQFAIQASGERVGAATWRAFAGAWPDAAAREAFLACAPLEEASAVFLEGLRGRFA